MYDHRLQTRPVAASMMALEAAVVNSSKDGTGGDVVTTGQVGDYPGP
jgi:hypothetical protein